MQTMDSEIKDEIFVDEYTGGLVGPSLGFAATIKDGGHIRCVVPPGCWGPMITPEFRGGHEVTRPVAVEGARVGDALARQPGRGDRREQYSLRQVWNGRQPIRLRGGLYHCLRSREPGWPDGGCQQCPRFCAASPRDGRPPAKCTPASHSPL